MDEFKVLREKPYQLEVMVNSNTESEERNLLKLKLIFDLPPAYPEEVPLLRIKNLSPDYLDNKLIDKYEEQVKTQAEESRGAMMIFELSELLRDSITEINDEVLRKLDEIEKKNDVMQHETLG